jgi:hypothetical protein
LVFKRILGKGSYFLPKNPSRYAPFGLLFVLTRFSKLRLG